MLEAALGWLRKAIEDHGWWYRPEVLVDDDLAALENDPAFHALKAVSDARYEEAVSRTEAVLSWKAKTADDLLLAVHGNTQNGETARGDWTPVLAGDDRWQLETIQSAEPDGFGTYRWSYDMTSYLPVADAMEKLQGAGYQKFVCGGFSAGCDMLLRAVTFTAARCDMLLLQSPWIPLLEEQAEALIRVIGEKKSPCGFSAVPMTRTACPWRSSYTPRRSVRGWTRPLRSRKTAAISSQRSCIR